MKDIKTYCIDTRRNAIFSAYDVKDPGNLKVINDYFKKVEEFAKDCKDPSDFESKFSTSQLSSEYSNIFAQIMQTECTIEGIAPVNKIEEEYTIEDEIRDDTKRAIRRRARQDAYDVARDIPVVGEALTAKQHFDFFSRFKKNK